MKCPKCHTENLADSAFCEECSAPLETACPTCGTGNRPTAKFCRKCREPLAASDKLKAESQTATRAPLSYTPQHLAAKILQSKSALEGERKQVTVLFADVKGSMDLAGQVDPEEWHHIMDRFFAILSDGVHRFEGTVNQYTGDGIMALFGAPIAHEDHARRACYAALHLTDELRPYANELRLRRGLNFSVRMGINCGEVIVGRIGDDLRMDYTAQGHTVGLAARMEQIAEPGKVYLTEHAATLVHGFFQLGDLGQLEVKGVPEPLRVYELQGVGQFRTRLDISRTRGFSRFVGRAEEMQTLEAALTRAQGGNAQIIGIVGEAGLGKSRLCAEFLERCRASGLMTYEATGVAHGKTIPFLPMLQLCRAFFGITEQDSDATARERIAGRLLLLDETFRDSLPLVFDFLAVPDPEHPAPRMDPEARQRQIIEVFKGVIQARGQRETTVTLLEDLHWFDGGSEAMLEPLLDARPGTRGLVMVNFRPEYHPEWTRKSYYHQVALQPLGPDAIRQLLVDLLGTDRSIDGLAEAIHARTAGNPFFTEEVVQTLIESGKLVGTRGNYRLVAPVDRLEVPGTVQAVLAARIDRLPELQKQTLQTAAVIGKSFTEPILKAVIGVPKGGLSEAALAEALRALKAAEFIYEQALYPVAEFVFKHPLTQEVAYNSQLQEHRAGVHAAVARAIETANPPDKLDEQAALLAHHWEAAGDAFQAARWHSRAAAWVGTSDAAQALNHWHQVRELLQRSPDLGGVEESESVERAKLGVAACVQVLQLGWRVGMSEEEAARMLAEGRALAAHTDDARLLAGLLASYGVVRGFMGDVGSYVQSSIEGAQAAERSGDAVLRMDVAIGVAYSLFLAGRLRESISTTEGALALAPADARPRSGFSNIDPYVWLTQHRGSLYLETGQLAEAGRHYERALHMAREQQDNENLAWAHMVYVTLLYRRGDAAGAVAHARQAFEIAEKVGSSVNRMLAHTFLGQAYLVTEEWDAAVEAEEHALRILRETHVGLVWESAPLLYLSEAHLGRGEAVRALECAERAVSVCRQRATPLAEADALIARARALLRCDDQAARTEIERSLSQAFTIVEQTGGRCRLPFIAAVRAELAQFTGDQTARQNELRHAQRLFAEMGATEHSERLARACAD